MKFINAERDKINMVSLLEGVMHADSTSCVQTSAFMSSVWDRTGYKHPHKCTVKSCC